MNRRTSQSTAVKTRIFKATLKLIREQGMRAIRHRAVATEAGVSLGSTTYHFSDIEDLISSTFIYWHENVDVGKNPYFVAISDDVGKLVEQNAGYKDIAEKIYIDGEQYLYDQIFNHRDNRLIELAFHNEALRNSRLSELLINSWETEVNRLAKLYQLLGSCEPLQDAEITFGLILQIEKKVLLPASKDKQLELYKKNKLTLKRHIYLIAKGLQLPGNKKPVI